MKKRTIIILSILLILIPALFVVIKGSLVMHSVVHKEEKRFCPPAPIDLVQPKDRKLIKTGDLSFECANLGETRREIEAAVKQHGGFIVNERLYHGYNKKTSNQALKIRVPSERFDALVADISKGAQRVDQRTIVIEDVTEQYIDTETRLAVKCQLETRYRELLTEAKTVKDILSIEEQLATLREDIESAEGKLKRLDDQVALSTLDVTYYVSLDESPEFARYFRNGLGNGWENLVWFFVGLLNIWPFILIVVLLVGGFIYRKKTENELGGFRAPVRPALRNRLGWGWASPAVRITRAQGLTGCANGLMFQAVMRNEFNNLLLGLLLAGNDPVEAVCL